MMWAASVDFSEPLAWVNEVVLRAGPVPLNIAFPPFSVDPHIFLNVAQMASRFRGVQSMMEMQNPGDSFAVALSLAPRSHTFIVRIYPSRWEFLLENIFRFPMPRLHTLSVGIETQRLDGNFTIPTALFSDYTPHLKNLILSGCNTDIYSPVFHKLTTLSISNPGFLHALAPARWLEVLVRLPELEDLVLNHAFPQSNNHLDIPVAFDPLIVEMLPAVELTRLKYFELAGNLEMCSQLFVNLRLPPSCAIVIECYNSRANDSYRDMASKLQHQLGSWEDGGHKVVKSIRLATSSAQLGFNNKNPGPEGEDTLWLYWLPPFSADVNAIPLLFPPFLSILSTISLGVVDMDLRFHGSNPLTDSQLIQLFLPFTNLQVLYIIEKKTLDRLLLIFNEYDEKHETALLPALHVLSLEYIYFGNQPRYSDLFHFLQRRWESGFPISTVKLRECGGFREADVKSLGISVDWEFLT